MRSPRPVGLVGGHPSVKAKNSYVDETLFGSVRPCGPPKSCGGASPTRCGSRGRSVSGSPPSGGAKAAASPARAGTVVLTKSQMDRMLEKSPILTPAALAQKRREAEDRVAEELRQAKVARAARQEAAAAKTADDAAAAPRTQAEQLREDERREIISKAQLALLEEKEEVRLMNQMIHLSKVMASRDQQVAHKAASKLSAAEAERDVVERMAQRRRAEEEEQEERERRRAVAQKRGALTILDQLAERERERAASEERRRAEGQEMTRRIQQLRDEEQQLEEERKAAARALLAEVALGNAELAERKRLAKQAEAREDLQIAEYIRQKDAREQELADERESQARLKELEVARLRAMQEKILDNRSAQDEARAKRYQDELEMAQRARAAAEQERRRDMQRDLEASRVAQLARKAERREEEARLELAEVDRIQAVKREKEEAEHEEEIARLEARKRHQQRLLAQMDERREIRSQARQELVEEGRLIRGQLAEERALLEAVKRLKMQELEAAGVPHKYHAQLARLQVGKPRGFN